MGYWRSCDEYKQILSFFTRNLNPNDVKFGFVVIPCDDMFDSIQSYYGYRLSRLLNVAWEATEFKGLDATLGKDFRIDRVINPGNQIDAVKQGVELPMIAGTNALHDRFYAQVGPMLDNIYRMDRGSVGLMQTLLRSFNVYFCAYCESGEASKVFAISRASDMMEAKNCGYSEWLDSIQYSAQWLIDNFDRNKIGDLKDQSSKFTNNIVKAMYLAYTTKIR